MGGKKEIFDEQKLKEALSYLNFVKLEKEDFLNTFNPWQKKENNKLIKEFIEALNDKDKSFSWLDILNNDKYCNEKIKDQIRIKNKYVDMRFQIPEHFHGDIDNAILFHCMENPRGYLAEFEKEERKKEKNEIYSARNVKEFFLSTNKLKENEETVETNDVADIINKRYGIDKVDEETIQQIIYSETSAMKKEFSDLFETFKDKDFKKNYKLSGNTNDQKALFPYYYIRSYYSQLINSTEKFNPQLLQNRQQEAECLGEKFCNIEIYPFSSTTPDLAEKQIGNEILMNSEVSRLGVYIILRRIYKSLERKSDKPIIIFRKYEQAWEKLIKEIFKGIKESNKKFPEEEVLKYLEQNYFYCQINKQGGGITSGNVCLVSDYKEFKKNKTSAFEHIKSLLNTI